MTEEELLDLMCERLPDIERDTIARVLRAYAWHRIANALADSGVNDAL